MSKINREYWSSFLRDLATKIESGEDLHAVALTHSASIGDPAIPMDAACIGWTVVVSSLPLDGVIEEKIKAAIEGRG